MFLLQQIDTVLGILVSLATLVGFAGLYLRGRRRSDNVVSAHSSDGNTVQAAHSSKSIFPWKWVVALVGIVAVGFVFVRTGPNLLPGIYGDSGRSGWRRGNEAKQNRWLNRREERREERRRRRRERDR